jgi:hypothetical protein
MDNTENENIDLIPLSEGDKLDVYRAFLLGKCELIAKQEEMFERYLFADKLLCQGAGKKGGLSYSNTVTIVSSHFQMSKANAYKVVRESQELFGDALESMKSAQKRVAYENFIRIANKAEEQDNYEAAISARDKAAKLYGLYDEEKGLSNEQIMQQLNINPVFVTNNTQIVQKGKGKDE